MKELTRKQKIVALGAFALVNLSLAMRLLMKNGSESIFGLQGRTWAFACLGLCVVLLIVVIKGLVTPDKSES